MQYHLEERMHLSVNLQKSSYYSSSMCPLPGLLLGYILELIILNDEYSTNFVPNKSDWIQTFYQQYGHWLLFHQTQIISILKTKCILRMTRKAHDKKNCWFIFIYFHNQIGNFFFSNDSLIFSGVTKRMKFVHLLSLLCRTHNNFVVSR